MATTQTRSNQTPRVAPTASAVPVNKPSLGPAKAAANGANITKAPMVAYLAPARPNLPSASAYVPCPAMVPQGASIAWHGSNGNANLYPRFNAMPAGGMVKLGPAAPSAKRLHGTLAQALGKVLANGPVLWGTISGTALQGHGTLAAHLTYLTGHGIIVLA